MNKRTRTVFYGILLIAVAVCLVLWKLNVFNLPVALAGVSTWGLIIAALMILIFIHSIIDINFAGILFPIAIVCIIFDDALGITAITPWVVLIAALLLTIALSMIFPKAGFRRFHKQAECGGYAGPVPPHEGPVISNAENNGYVMHSMRFGSATKYIRSQNLERADLSSQFGELSVSFDGAQVPGGVVTINVQASFGQMNLFIPRTWKVENKVSATLGECRENFAYADVNENSVVCRIIGSVSFGEINISRI